MKKILVVAATEMEVHLLKQYFKKTSNIVFFIHRVGIPLSLYNLYTYLLNNPVKHVIQVGIGGSFSKKFPLQSVAIIQQDCFGDMGVYQPPNFTSIFDMGFVNKNLVPFKNEFLKNPYLKKGILDTYCSYANAITVQQITTNKKIIHVLQKKYNADIESMEGACLHFICLKHKIPFIQIRSVSNYVGERDLKNWCIKEALESLKKASIPLIESISNLYQ